MRKGYALIEILILILVVPLMLVVIDGLFRTLLTDIPWSSRIVQENTTVLNMLEQLHRDVDQAKGNLRMKFKVTPAEEQNKLVVSLAYVIAQMSQAIGLQVNTREVKNEEVNNG